MKLTLVLPVYNEEVNIQKGVLDKIGNYTKENDDFVDVLIVDDGSDDKSAEIIKKKYLPKFSKFSFINGPHQGKAFAVMEGIRAAKGDYVMFSDFDLATPIEEAEKLIDGAQNGAKIVIGSRSSKREGAPFLRRIMAVGFIVIRNILLNIGGIRDTQCGFKLFEKKATLKILSRLAVFKEPHSISGSSVSAGFDLEFLFLAAKMGYKIKEVPVIWRHVETKNVHFMTDSIETLRDILKIRVSDLRGRYS